MTRTLAYLLDLRVRARGNPEGLALIDRAIAILGRARTATPDELAQLHREVHRLADDLARRYGAPKRAVVH